MKKNLPLFLLLLLSYQFYAQDKTIDSLLVVLGNTDNDSITMDGYNKLRRATYYNDPDTSRYYTKKYLEFARKRKDSHNIVLAHFFLGNAQLIDGSYTKASQNYLISATYYEVKKDSARLTSVLTSLGVVQEKINNDSLALTYHLRAKTIAKNNGDDRRSAIASVNIANIYLRQEAFQKAIDNLEEAALIFAISPNYKAFLSMTNLNLAQAYRENRDFVQSQQLYNKLLQEVDSAEDPYNYANVLRGISELSSDQKDEDKALTYGENAFEIYTKNNFNDERLQMFPELISLYRAKGESEKALKLYDQYQSVKDSLLNTETTKNIANAIQKYETEKKDAQLKVVTLEKDKANQQKRLYSYLVIAFVLLAGLISFFLYKNKKKNALLATQKKQLQSALNDKEILLKEIHHRVKNNLQVVSSLLSLQQRQTEDKDTAQAIQVGRDRVKAMSLIHQNLYQEGNLIGVSVKDYIESLANNLVKNYSTTQKDIDLKLNIDALTVNVDTIIPIGLIINELISNALKYAFTKSEQGSIEINLIKQQDAMQLSVKDNGSGLPTNFKPEETSSLGYRLIRAFSDKLKATLAINSSHMGTEVVLYMPYSK